MFFSGKVMCKRQETLLASKGKLQSFVLKLLLSESTLPKAMGRQPPSKLVTGLSVWTYSPWLLPAISSWLFMDQGSPNILTCALILWCEQTKIYVNLSSILAGLHIVVFQLIFTKDKGFSTHVITYVAAWYF